MLGLDADDALELKEPAATDGPALVEPWDVNDGRRLVRALGVVAPRCARRQKVKLVATAHVGLDDRGDHWRQARRGLGRAFGGEDDESTAERQLDPLQLQQHPRVSETLQRAAGELRTRTGFLVLLRTEMAISIAELLPRMPG